MAQPALPSFGTSPRWPGGALAERGASGAVSAEGADALLRRISADFSTLSPQLQVIARYVERHLDELVLTRIQDVAAHCEVQPSAVVRFAKRFGFRGYSELKRSLRTGLSPQGRASSWVVQTRMRAGLGRTSGSDSGGQVAATALQVAADGLQELQRDLHLSVVDDAVALLLQAPALWIVGVRRAFPVAAYWAYMFQHGPVPVQFLSLMGGMQFNQLRGVQPGDVLLAVSFAPYGEETLDVARAARTRGAHIIALTDSALGALAGEADVALTVEEPSTLGFRGLTNSMAAAQAIFLAYAQDHEALRVTELAHEAASRPHA